MPEKLSNKLTLCYIHVSGKPSDISFVELQGCVLGAWASFAVQLACKRPVRLTKELLDITSGSRDPCYSGLTDKQVRAKAQLPVLLSLHRQAIQEC